MTDAFAPPFESPTASFRLLSWNVNGYRACLQKGFRDWAAGCGADVVMLQETKAEPEQLDAADRRPPGWTTFWSASRVKKGHSGVACFCRRPPLSVAEDLPDPAFQGEGRVLRLEYERFWLFNIYFPNSGMGPDRLAYKLGFYAAFLAHAEELRRIKPVVVGGDFNIAHTPLDLKHPERHETTPGYLPEERAWMDRLAERGYVDTFRLFDPSPGRYTWWPYYRKHARAANSGWRIDYFLVTEELRPAVTRAWIEPEVLGSDHCPVGLELSA